MGKILLILILGAPTYLLAETFSLEAFYEKLHQAPNESVATKVIEHYHSLDSAPVERLLNEVPLEQLDKLPDHALVAVFKKSKKQIFEWLPGEYLPSKKWQKRILYLIQYELNAPSFFTSQERAVSYVILPSIGIFSSTIAALLSRAPALNDITSQIMLGTVFVGGAIVAVGTSGAMLSYDIKRLRRLKKAKEFLSSHPELEEKLNQPIALDETIISPPDESRDGLYQTLKHFLIQEAHLGRQQELKNNLAKGMAGIEISSSFIIGPLIGALAGACTHGICLLHSHTNRKNFDSIYEYLKTKLETSENISEETLSLLLHSAQYSPRAAALLSELPNIQKRCDLLLLSQANEASNAN